MAYKGSLGEHKQQDSYFITSLLFESKVSPFFQCPDGKEKLSSAATPANGKRGCPSISGGKHWLILDCLFQDQVREGRIEGILCFAHISKRVLEGSTYQEGTEKAVNISWPLLSDYYLVSCRIENKKDFSLRSFFKCFK